MNKQEDLTNVFLVIRNKKGISKMREALAVAEDILDAVGDNAKIHLTIQEGKYNNMEYTVNAEVTKTFTNDPITMDELEKLCE